MVFGDRIKKLPHSQSKVALNKLFTQAEFEDSPMLRSISFHALKQLEQKPREFYVELRNNK